MKEKKILIVPSRFPTKYQTNNYIFVKEQVVALAESAQIVVVGCIPISLKYFLKEKFRLGKIDSYYIGSVKCFFIYFPSIPKTILINEIIRYFLNRFLIKRKIKAFKPDVIHFHSVWAASIGGWVSSKFKIPCVITEHSSLFLNKVNRTHNLIARRAFERTDVIIAVSESLARALRKMYNIDPVVISNLVDTSFFSPKLAAISTNPIIFTTIGNLVDVKNHQRLILAFKKFLETHSNTILKIIGSGPNYNKLRSTIRENDLEESVYLLGYKTRYEIREILDNSNYFVLASLRETFGVVVIEALSMGLPIMCTRFGGIAEELVDQEFCILVENDINSLAKGLESLTYWEKKDEIRAFAISKYSKSIIVNELDVLYSKLLRA